MPLADGEVFDRNDAVAADGENGARHDLDASGARAQSERWLARRLRCLDSEPPGAPTHRPTIDRDAIHRYPIERRRVTLGVDILAQHRTRALREWQRLNGQTLQVLPDQLLGLGGGQLAHGSAGHRQDLISSFSCWNRSCCWGRSWP